MNGMQDAHYKKDLIPAAKKHQVEEELADAIGGTNEILVKATTAFPFTLFPDTVTVDRAKVSITHRSFFRIGEVLSIRIEDILNVAANVGPIFGSIKISTRFFDPQKPYHVNYFWREDALRLKRVMQGYLIALQKNIDCSVLSAQELTKLFDELGQTASDEKV